VLASRAAASTYPGAISGALDAEVAESYADDTALRDTGCRAKPALEMVWKA